MLGSAHAVLCCAEHTNAQSMQTEILQPRKVLVDAERKTQLYCLILRANFMFDTAARQLRPKWGWDGWLSIGGQYS